MWAQDLIGRAGAALEKVAEKASRTLESHDHIRRLPASGTVPPPRESHSVTAIGSKLYVFGGFDGARVLNDLYVFDAHAGLWTQLVHTGISPAARAGHSATALGVPAHLVVFGGANSSRRFADVQLFDTADGHWTKPAVRGRPPTARYYHCACLARGSLLVFGGSDGEQCLADLHALNAESWTWSEPLTNGPTPSPRHGHTGTLVNKLLFVVGGVGDGPGASELGDLHVLDTESWSWWRPAMPSPLPPIAHHAAALIADKILLYGGSTRDALYNDVIMIDSSSCTWQVVQNGDAAKLPRRRRLGAARGAGTRLLLFGGWDGSHTCADLLEIDTSAWLRMEDSQPKSKTAPGGGAAIEVRARRPAATGVTGGGGGGAAAGGSPGGERGYAVLPGGAGFGSHGVGEGSGLDLAMERLEQRHEEELQRLRGEVARLRMSNELMGRELGKLKTIVGASMPGEHGGVDVDALASRKEMEALRAEVSKLRRLREQERELDQGAVRAEIDSLKRMVNALSLRLADVTAEGQLS